MSDKFDVVIVGAGPAGLFAAYELVTVNSGLNVCLIDRGPSIKNRTSRDVMCGVGGTGLFSDVKLHVSAVLSHEMMLRLVPVQEYQEVVDYVDSIFTEYGAPDSYFPREEDEEKVRQLVDEAGLCGIKLVSRKVRHVGSDNSPRIIARFEDFLVASGVTLRTNCHVERILVENGSCVGVLTKDNEEIFASYVLIAPGRLGSAWLQKLAVHFNLGHNYEKVLIGARVEFPAAVMQRHSDVMYEPIFLIRTPTYDDQVRTFCPCPRGKVSMESYDGYIGVNGFSESSYASGNSNFAFLTEVQLVKPVENTTDYAEMMARMATTLGGGKPILQRLADLRCSRRSTWERISHSFVEPTLREVTPGDIAMALSGRIVVNLLEGLEILDRILPGINNGSTLLYVPELKNRSSVIQTDSFLATAMPGLFMAGEGAGVSGNIVGAAATGVIAARGILKQGGKNE